MTVLETVITVSRDFAKFVFGYCPIKIAVWQ